MAGTGHQFALALTHSPGVTPLCHGHDVAPSLPPPVLYRQTRGVSQAGSAGQGRGGGGPGKQVEITAASVAASVAASGDGGKVEAEVEEEEEHHCMNASPAMRGLYLVSHGGAVRTW